MLKGLEEIQPQIVIVDPVSSFVAAGTDSDARSMLMRMIDLLKTRQITVLMTSLTGGGRAVEQSEVGISSLIDSWVMVRNLEQAGERTRTLSIIKSRGMKHSNQARELVLSDQGVDLAEVFIGPDGGILTGSARMAQEAADGPPSPRKQKKLSARRPPCYAGARRSMPESPRCRPISRPRSRKSTR